MASSKVMPSSTSANSDLARQSSIYKVNIGELQSDQSKNFSSMSMDELMRNIYGDNSTPEFIPDTSRGDGELNGGTTPLSRQVSFSLPKNVGNKSVEEVWKEIKAADNGGGVDQKIRGEGEEQFEEMTLEAFLSKVGAVREEDVRIPEEGAASAAEPMPEQRVFAVNSVLSNQFQFQRQQQQVERSILGFRNGAEAGGGGRGKRRAGREPLDRASQQRQKKMIKNRESAARSRERKQAYTVELESLVSQLEAENARLLKQQLMLCFIPVEDKQRSSSRVLRRVHSMQW